MLFVLGLAMLSGGCASGTIAPKAELVPPKPPEVFDDADWAAVLRENVKEGLVDYNHLAAHRQGLDRFVALISVAGPDSTPKLFATRSAKLAYWINAYNALVLCAVLEVYPTPTMYDLGLKRLEHDYRFVVDGRQVRLHDLVQRLRTTSQDDVRMIFALCSAARGSPPLGDQPYRTATLDQQLARAARDAVGNAGLVRVDHEGRRLLLGQDIVSALDRLVSYHERRTGARGAKPINALLSFAPSARTRESLNRAVGYAVGAIPFDRRLNLWGELPARASAAAAPARGAP